MEQIRSQRGVSCMSEGKKRALLTDENRYGEVPGSGPLVSKSGYIISDLSKVHDRDGKYHPVTIRATKQGHIVWTYNIGVRERGTVSPEYAALNPEKTAGKKVAPLLNVTFTSLKKFEPDEVGRGDFIIMKGYEKEVGERKQPIFVPLSVDVFVRTPKVEKETEQSPDVMER